MLAHVFVETTQNFFTPIDQNDFAAEAIENACKLYGNVAATLNQDASRHFFQMERFVRRNGILFASNRRAVMRSCTSRDEDCFSAYARTRREANCMPIFNGRPAFYNFNIVTFERSRVSGFQASDFTVFVGDQCAPIKSGLADRPAISRGVFKFIGKTRGIHQKLLRNATADHAGSTDTIFFGDHYARAIASSDPCSSYAAGACPNNKKIEVVIAQKPLSTLMRIKNVPASPIIQT